MKISFDPGKKVLPWCAWSELHTLIAAGLSIAPDHLRGLAALAGWHYLNIRKTLGDHGLWRQTVDHVWIEQMGLNKGRDPTLPKAIATGNDLLEIQAIAAYVAGRLSGSDCGLSYLPPGTWKGTAPKHVTQARVEATLTGIEMKVLETALQGVAKGRHHNLYDAAGIGMYGTGRYRIRGPSALSA